jgi:hypothetical protein
MLRSLHLLRLVDNLQYALATPTVLFPSIQGSSTAPLFDSLDLFVTILHFLLKTVSLHLLQRLIVDSLHEAL